MHTPGMHTVVGAVGTGTIHTSRAKQGELSAGALSGRPCVRDCIVNCMLVVVVVVDSCVKSEHAVHSEQLLGPSGSRWNSSFATANKAIFASTLRAV